MNDAGNQDVTGSFGMANEVIDSELQFKTPSDSSHNSQLLVKNDGKKNTRSVLNMLSHYNSRQSLQSAKIQQAQTTEQVVP